MLAIDRRGSTVTLASSRARQQTFEADGVAHQENISNRSTQVTATLQGDQLTVSSTGYRENDFKVTFESIENGNRLRVRRQIYLEGLNQPVVVNSIYNRTSEVAQWNIYNGSAQPVLGSTNGNNDDFIVRDGETIVAVLNDNLTTEQAKQGDRFTMTVREPGQYEGAVIEGTVGTVDQGGRITGRSGLSLNFDTIRLRNGKRIALPERSRASECRMATRSMSIMKEARKVTTKPRRRSSGPASALPLAPSSAPLPVAEKAQ